MAEETKNVSPEANKSTLTQEDAKFLVDVASKKIDVVLPAISQLAHSEVIVVLTWILAAVLPQRPSFLDDWSSIMAFFSGYHIQLLNEFLEQNPSVAQAATRDDRPIVLVPRMDTGQPETTTIQ